MKRVHVYISGRVQGVFFRAITKQTAMNYDLTGWVRNMDDGRVEALFEGKAKSVDKMIEWCHIGPSSARVEEVIKTEETYIGEFHDFSVKY
jgi:acylphosphatase